MPNIHLIGLENMRNIVFPYDVALTLEQKINRIDWLMANIQIISNHGIRYVYMPEHAMKCQIKQPNKNKTIVIEKIKKKKRKIQRIYFCI